MGNFGGLHHRRGGAPRSAFRHITFDFGLTGQERIEPSLTKSMSLRRLPPCANSAASRQFLSNSLPEMSWNRSISNQLPQIR